MSHLPSLLGRCVSTQSLLTWYPRRSTMWGCRYDLRVIEIRAEPPAPRRFAGPKVRCQSCRGSNIDGMTASVLPRLGSAPSARRDLSRLVVLVSAVVVVAARLPFIGRSPGPDEGGFLVVARQWHAGGSSLYGNYWVDRPPLLLTIFRWAAQLGGLVPLRLIGCLAAALIVMFSADLARRMAGPRAARWTAVAACAFLVSPHSGGYEVNGELLAAPFVLAGMSSVLAALTLANSRRAARSAALAGALAVCALLVKQNIADVGVFAVVAGSVSLGRHEVSGARLGRLVVAMAIGGGAALAVVSAWTVLHGTSLSGVYEAMYPFRIEAGRVMSEYGGSHAVVRSHRLLASFLWTGLATVIAMAAWAIATRRLHGAAVWALGATIAFDGLSIVLGGNFWVHYLVQLIGPVSVVAGVLAAARLSVARFAVAAASALAIWAWTSGFSTQVAADGATVGRSIGASARPGDSIVTVFGQAHVVETSGLSSPYPYLWSLPVKTLDPHLHRLDVILLGHDAPTWLVAWKHLGGWGLDNAATKEIVARDYHVVASICGHTVYLHNGINRPSPTGRCSTTSAIRAGAPVKENVS